MTQPSLTLHVSENGISHLFTIMQHGAYIATTVGIPVGMLLREHLTIPEAYLAAHVETIFIDGRPVDDAETATVHDGARIGLAAALPGAAGIAMRRNSPYAALRGTISITEKQTCPAPANGEITLLLFNNIMHDLAGKFLQQGVVTTGGILGFVLKHHPAFPTLRPEGQVSTQHGEAHSSVAISTVEELMAWCTKNPKTRLCLRVCEA